MAKSEKGVGPYSKVDADSTPQKVPTKSWTQGSKDRSKIVDSNSEANGGFPAPLKPDRK